MDGIKSYEVSTKMYYMNICIHSHRSKRLEFTWTTALYRGDSVGIGLSQRQGYQPEDIESSILKAAPKLKQQTQASNQGKLSGKAQAANVT